MPSVMDRAVKASIIVRFAERAGARTWLTSGLHPIYCKYSPGGFARRAFSIPQQRGWRVRVRVYVDGFNLYYGALKARPESRWLDLVALSRLLRPSDAIDAIRYFTARVKGNRDATAPGKQKLYLAALDTLPLVTVHFGQFRTHPVAMPLANPVSGRKRTARVLKTEEKGSDVNLATHLLLDGFDGLYEAAVVISDDSDLEAPIREANRRFGSVHVVSPRGPTSTPAGPKAPYQMSHAGSSWTPLDPALLSAAQLPSPLRLRSGRSIHRPPTWT